MKEETPLVPGFGIGEEATVPGFGVSPSTTALASMTTVLAGGGSAVKPGGEVDSRVRGFAEGMFRRYDRNQSGTLEKDEWGEIRGDPNSMDRNRDGRITMDEYVAGVAEYMKSRRDRESGDSGRRGDSNGDQPEDAAARKSYRFLSPSERLPEEARGWISERDGNGDGQVAMAEFTRSWSEDRVREFLRYDHNADGFVTAMEYLQGPSSDETSVASAPMGGGGSPGGSPSGPAPSGSSPQPGAAAASAPSGGDAKPWWMQ
jgi:Ca2+-binding EF-hand superfamily protein